MQHVRIYTTNYCGFCAAAKSLLGRRGVPYEEIDVTGDHDRRAWLADVTGQGTVPQVFIGEESIGGYQELSALAASGELDVKLGAPS